MKISEKFKITFLLCSILLTNSCATIMTNWGEQKNVGYEISEFDRKLTEIVFNPTVEVVGKNLKIELRNQSFFEIKQREFNKYKKDNKWGWTLTIPSLYVSWIGIGLATFGSYFVTSSGNSEMALLSLLAVTVITVGDLILANSLSQETQEIKDVKKDEIKDTFLQNSKASLIIDDKTTYTGISDDKGIVEFNNIDIDYDEPVKKAILNVKTYEGKELTTNINPENLKSFATVHPPKITILEPFADERGISIVSKEESILIKGKAESKKGITQLLINGYERRLNKDNEFVYRLPLLGYENEVSIVVIDNKNNRTEKKLVINRKEQLVSVNKPAYNSQKLNWYKKQYALVVGVNEYQNAQIQSLKNAMNDAKSISQIFKEMGFQVKELYNSKATKKEIINAFREMTKKTEKEDSFIFYFAGHGQGLSLETNKRDGFIIPYDVSFDLSSGGIVDYDQEAISIDTIKKYTSSMKAKHIGLLLDSCFSGLALKRTIAKMERNYDINFYNNLLSRKSINILTAGDDQPVSDGSSHSPFTQALIRGLESNSLITDNKDGFVLFRDLSVYVKNKVEKSTEGRQRPQFDNLSEDDGDFIFKIHEYK